MITRKEKEIEPRYKTEKKAPLINILLCVFFKKKFFHLCLFEMIKELQEASERSFVFIILFFVLLSLSLSFLCAVSLLEYIIL